MKNFKQYLAESERTYNYRIKIVGDVTKDWIKQLEAKLQQFDPVKIGDAKSTPVQAMIPDFPKHKNDSVTSIDCEFRYPAIEPQIKQIARLMFMDENRIIMQTTAYDNSVDKEMKQYAEQPESVLTDTDYPADDKEQKELINDYSTGPYDHAVLKNSYRSSFTIAGGNTPPSETTNDLPQGTESPISNIKRIHKPQTGSSTGNKTVQRG
jgi:hypothetical protein